MSNLQNKPMPSFESYFVPALKDCFYPKTIEEAISLMVNYGKEASVLAGGTDLINLMRTRALTAEYVIDISRIPGLDYIKYDEADGLRVGALTTISTVGSSEIVKKNYPIIYDAVCLMGSVQIRNKATIVGNICRASPSADMSSPLLALNARVKIAGSSGARAVPLDKFFTGPGETVLKSSEIVTEVQVPALPAATGMAFLKATRVAVDLAKVNVATVLILSQEVCQDIGIALGGVAPTPMRAKEAEKVLQKKRLEDRLIEKAASIASGETECIGDLRAPADYRRELSEVLVKRAIRLSMERAKQRNLRNSG